MNLAGRLDNNMKLICQYAAKAVSRYSQVSGLRPTEMPEYFMPAYIFDKLGSKLTMTLESSSKQLIGWNEERRQKLRAIPNVVRKSLEETLKSLDRNGRIDLVVFDGSSSKKNSEGILLMVEFKKHETGRGSADDRNKLLRVLDYIETCPAGAVCYLVDAMPDSEVIRDHKKFAGNDKWYCEPVPGLGDKAKKGYSVCARLFERHPKVAA